MFPRRLIVGILCCVAAGLLASGCASKTKKKNYDVAVVRFMLEATTREEGGVVKLPQSGVMIPVAPKSFFTEYDIIRCEAIDNELGKSLAFQFSSEATRDLYRFTATNQGKRLVAVLNGQAVGAQRIAGPNAQGFVVMYVEVPDTELIKLAKNITLTSEDARTEAEKLKK